MSLFDIQAEGGWTDLGMVRHYTQNRPFEELQKMPTVLTAALRQARNSESGRI